MSQQQRSPYEDVILAAIVVGLICGLAFIIWKVFRLQLVEVLRWVRVGELQLATMLNGENFMLNGESLAKWRDWLSGAKAADITNDHIVVSTPLAVQPLRHIFVGLIGFMALFVIFKGPGTSYRRRMNLEMLMAEQAKSFPAITPFLRFDPRDMPFRAPGAAVPAQLPLFAEALSPEEWLAYHDIPYVAGQVDAAKAWQALGLQLGRRWEGPQKLPLHAQALYAAFCLKAVRKRKDCDKLLADLALSWSADKGFNPNAKLRAQIAKIIKDPKMGKSMEAVANQHGYETTALLRCLQRARQEGGVLAPSEFVWLRGHDRTLWYPLNNLGRKSYMPEAAGALVHFTNELIAGQKIPTPRFEEVIRGLQDYMKSGAARSVPERDAKAKNPQLVKLGKKKKGK